MHQGYSPDSVRRVRPVLSEQQCQRPLPQAKTMTRKNAHAATRGNPAPPRAGAGVPPRSASSAWLMTPSNPASCRHVVFRIHVDQITGRESRS